MLRNPSVRLGCSLLANEIGLVEDDLARRLIAMNIAIEVEPDQEAEAVEAPQPKPRPEVTDPMQDLDAVPEPVIFDEPEPVIPVPRRRRAKSE